MHKKFNDWLSFQTINHFFLQKCKTNIFTLHTYENFRQTKETQMQLIKSSIIQFKNTITQNLNVNQMHIPSFINLPMSTFSNFRSDKQQFWINKHPLINRAVRIRDRTIRTNGFRCPWLIISIPTIMITITIAIYTPFFFTPLNVAIILLTVTHTAISNHALIPHLHPHKPLKHHYPNFFTNFIKI